MIKLGLARKKTSVNYLCSSRASEVFRYLFPFFQSLASYFFLLFVIFLCLYIIVGSWFNDCIIVSIRISSCLILSLICLHVSLLWLFSHIFVAICSFRIRFLKLSVWYAVKFLSFLIYCRAIILFFFYWMVNFKHIDRFLPVSPLRMLFLVNKVNRSKFDLYLPMELFLLQQEPVMHGKKIQMLLLLNLLRYSDDELHCLHW